MSEPSAAFAEGECVKGAAPPRFSPIDTILPGKAASEAGSEGAPAVIPGRFALTGLADLTRGLDRDAFAKRYAAPFLLQLNENGTTTGARSTASSGNFHTVSVAEALAGPASGKPSSPVHAYELRKRPGANAFALMITVGRALNNDIVVPHPSVSKFHASFALDQGGEWTLTDASSNGTWVDGEKLAPKRPRVIRAPTCMSLAREIVLVLMTPDALFDELERFRKGSPLPA